jgi:hypothetical protein
MRLIIVTNSAVTQTAARNALTVFLEAKGWPVWHWFEDLWLIDKVPANIDTKELRLEILRAIPSLLHILILSAEGSINRSGRVPLESVEWFKEHWEQNQ